MAKKTPASFPCYSGDWLGSARIAAMLPEQEGAYFRLLLYAWEDEGCCIPSDDASLAGMSRLGSRWKKLKAPILACFDTCPEHDDRLVNQKLWEVRQSQSEFSEQQRRAGSKGAAKRWGRHGNPNGDGEGSPPSGDAAPNATPMAKNGLPIPIPIPTQNLHTDLPQEHRVHASRKRTGPVENSDPDPEPDALTIRQQQLVVELRELTGETEHVGLYCRIVQRLPPVTVERVKSELRLAIQRGEAERPGKLMVHIAKRLARETGVRLFAADEANAA